MLRIFKQDPITNKYLLELKIVVNDSGPLKSNQDVKRQPVSLVFNGQFMYFYEDVFNSNTIMIKKLEFTEGKLAKEKDIAE